MRSKLFARATGVGSTGSGSSRVAMLLAMLGAAAATAAAQGPPLIRTEGWRHLFDPGAADPGVGVVTFVSPRQASWADTLPLFAQPGGEGPIGRFVFAADSVRGWVYAVEWADTLTTNLLEYGYEEAGLPVDSLSDDGAWARVIPGFATDGGAVRAWAPIRPGLTELVRWRERLAEHDLFFRAGVTPAFFDAPGGAPVPFPLRAADDGDYILHPLEIRGSWMRVRAVTPSDMCDNPAAPQVAELWIRFLDPSGRPAVWYYTRGC